MTARKKTKRIRIRKKPNTVSTDAALFTATLLQFAGDQIEGGDFMQEFLSSFLGSSQGTTVLSFEKLGKSFERGLTTSLDRAADLLSRMIFFENLLKRLDFDDPKHIVAFNYCLLRLTPSSAATNKAIEIFKSRYGKYWRWPLVWIVSQQFETVRLRAENEAARGDLFLKGWQDECQRYANNLWIEEKKKSTQIAVRKKAMIESVKLNPIAQEIH